MELQFVIVALIWLAPQAFGQDLNVLPYLLKPFLIRQDEYQTFNFMANVSEKLFHIQQMGFEPMILRNDYDFIIVGSGPAGCVLANRLSQNKNWNILLLEAGRPESLPNFIPLAGVLVASSSYNWDYYAEPNKGSCMGMQGQQCVNTHGKALGGSSTINYMIFTRGNRHDFDEWADQGNKGWSYEEVLPYFKKFETANVGDHFDPRYRGAVGELNVDYPRYRSGLTDLFMLATKEAGYNLVDYNGATQMGVSIMQTTTKNGRRHSAAEAFIRPIYRTRKNLHILTSALVTKILIDAETKTAMGVTFQRGKDIYTVYAKKEVILSAGVFHSPQLLMLSGVGPEDHLKAHNIEVIKDLPVGKRMYDHMIMTTLTFIVNTTGQSINFKKIGPLEVAQFIQGRGVLTSPLGFEAVAYGKREDSRLASDQPDYELLFFPGSIGSDLGIGLAKEYNLRRDIYQKVYGPLESAELDMFSILTQQMRPKSYGRLLLRDSNIHSAPILDYSYFQDPDDVEVLLAGVIESLRISKTNVMQSIGATLHPIPIPDCAHLKFASDDYWRCSIRMLGVSVHHQVGTNRMGPEDDGQSVVDPELRVHGINRLRVADTSVLPTAVCAHTNAVSFMVGEKLADMIKDDWLV